MVLWTDDPEWLYGWLYETLGSFDDYQCSIRSEQGWKDFPFVVERFNEWPW
jgi:hypothetical protein